MIGDTMLQYPEVRGARLCPGSGIWIIVDYDRQRFIQTFIETPPHNNPHQCASDSVGNQAS